MASSTEMFANLGEAEIQILLEDDHAHTYVLWRTTIKPGSDAARQTFIISRPLCVRCVQRGTGG
jgi:hypothetical protein